jgi:phytoene dehydrogenase-like protein
MNLQSAARRKMLFQQEFLGAFSCENTCHSKSASVDSLLLMPSGAIPNRPFVIVAQPSVCDRLRAPSGQHAAWGYCHVPLGCSSDLTSAIETQVERFAPGFRDVILARHTMGPAELARSNANLVDGDISGGAMRLDQLFTRPTWRQYRTPLPHLFLCSASTPPGPGVHGMCGYWAARTALRADQR